MHHTISDGINAVRLSMQYMDLDPDATAALGGVVTERVAEPVPPPSMLDALRSFLEGSFRIPITISRQVAELLANPTAIPAASARSIETVRAIVAQLSDTEQARSPLWTERSLRRQLVTAKLPFRPVKDAAKRLGGTVNTAFLTVVTDAAARYHLERDAPVDHLRASMAVSTRTGDSGANAFSLVRLLVPSGEMSLRDRFEAIADTTRDAASTSGSANLDALATVATMLPTSVLIRMTRAQAQTVDFATSNVRASPVAVYVAGAKLLASYAIGPLLGVAANATMLSYDGGIDLGINTDAAAIDDPARLASLVERAGRELVKTKRRP
jgi:hypothetical protein